MARWVSARAHPAAWSPRRRIVRDPCARARMLSAQRDGDSHPKLSGHPSRAIGATTVDEYRKHIEKDAALERRFQPVKVGEPTVADTISILRGSEGPLRGAPQGPHPGRRDRRRGDAVAPLHRRPLPARQGDRPHRRGRGEAQDGDRLGPGGGRRGRTARDPARDRAAGAASTRATWSRKSVARSSRRSWPISTSSSRRRRRAGKRRRTRSRGSRHSRRRSSNRSWRPSGRSARPPTSAPRCCSTTRSPSSSPSSMRRPRASRDDPEGRCAPQGRGLRRGHRRDRLVLDGRSGGEDARRRDAEARPPGGRSSTSGVVGQHEAVAGGRLRGPSRARRAQGSEPPGRHVPLPGPTGVGKTELARALARRSSTTSAR